MHASANPFHLQSLPDNKVLKANAKIIVPHLRRLTFWTFLGLSAGFLLALKPVLLNTVMGFAYGSTGFFAYILLATLMQWQFNKYQPLRNKKIYAYGMALLQGLYFSPLIAKLVLSAGMPLVLSTAGLMLLSLLCTWGFVRQAEKPMGASTLSTLGMAMLSFTLLSFVFSVSQAMYASMAILFICTLLGQVFLCLKKEQIQDPKLALSIASSIVSLLTSLMVQCMSLMYNPNGKSGSSNPSEQSPWLLLFVCIAPLMMLYHSWKSCGQSAGPSDATFGADRSDNSTRSEDLAGTRPGAGRAGLASFRRAQHFSASAFERSTAVERN
jgi:hypothetical protein